MGDYISFWDGLTWTCKAFQIICFETVTCDYELLFLFPSCRVISPVGCGADVDFSRLAAWFKLVGQCDIVPKKAVARHLNPNYTSKYWTGVEADTHLGRKWDVLVQVSACLALHMHAVVCTMTPIPAFILMLLYSSPMVKVTSEYSNKCRDLPRNRCNFNFGKSEIYKYWCVYIYIYNFFIYFLIF